MRPVITVPKNSFINLTSLHWSWLKFVTVKKRPYILYVHPDEDVFSPSFQSLGIYIFITLLIYTRPFKYNVSHYKIQRTLSFIHFCARSFVFILNHLVRQIATYAPSRITFILSYFEYPRTLTFIFFDARYFVFILLIECTSLLRTLHLIFDSRS